MWIKTFGVHRGVESNGGDRFSLIKINSENG